MQYIDMVFELFRQEFPEKMVEIADSIIEVFEENGIEILPLEVGEAEYGTLEYIEKAQAKGYSAIVHDGKILGFRKETKENAL